MKLLGYDFEIKYNPGLLNKAAGALSRVPHEVVLASISVPTIIDLEVIQREVEEDSKLIKIRRNLEQDPMSYPKFTLDQGRLFYKGRVVVSGNSSLIPTILQMFHDSVFGGHSRFLRTYKCLTGELYWRNMKSDVKKYVEKCSICQRNKADSVSPVGLLQPLPIPNRIWEDISIDFIEGLPKSKGFDVILVVVDRLSKYSHFLALKHPFTAKEVATVFIKEIVRLHGFPHSIISDRDKIFVSNF